MNHHHVLSKTFLLLGTLSALATLFYFFSVSYTGAVTTLVITLLLFIIAFLHKQERPLATNLTWVYIALLLFFSISNMIYDYTNGGIFLLNILLAVFLAYWNMQKNKKANLE